MTKTEIAENLFKEGFHCSQALLTAYSTDLGLDRDIALKVASAFGGGIGKMGEMCGAVTGALMVLGLRYGSADARDRTSMARTYKTAREFVSSFKARNNSVRCRELLGFEIGSKPDSGKIISRQCPKYVKDAVEIVEGIFQKINI